jgi:hypothetical protein
MAQGKGKKHKNRNIRKKKEEINFFSAEEEESNEIVGFKNISVLSIEIGIIL